MPFFNLGGGHSFRCGGNQIREPTQLRFGDIFAISSCRCFFRCSASKLVIVHGGPSGSRERVRQSARVGA